ncbi:MULTISPECIES: EamA family transporter RarD [unclassified Limnobacter]|jgi:chloramphenicol-sensitive protein RarD|uniref:EamA family transporter RarD n=1 Tax=unclassified Limnobacter TaxID=2630203 RepID=UPI000C6690C0|nr:MULTISPECIES: EamA family transporter RarD [unclassified Limnobacter]MAZ11015.1 protein RarD [Sutterellaceae bacterium]|tara:strand:+ start:2683 stop:3585 length:903 start_codon:yes stop_codon:yes gene_type:complete
MQKGVFLSILASVLFGSMYYYTTLLDPLSGEEIYGWRMLLTLPVMTLFLIWTKEWGLIKSIALRLKTEWKLYLALPASSLLLGTQLWLFLWAPLHGHAMNVSLGYFMMPLVMVLIGRFYYRDKLSQLQKLAVLLALLGVTNAVFQAGGFAWTSLLVCLGYPYYFVLRSKFKIDNLGGLWFDMLLMTPLALYFALNGEGLAQMTGLQLQLPLLIILLGVLSASALIAYILSSRMLPFSLFGLLGYVEPVLLVVVAFLIGESIAKQEWPTYLAIWLSLSLLAVEGLLKLYRIESRSTNRGLD